MIIILLLILILAAVLVPAFTRSMLTFIGLAILALFVVALLAPPNNTSDVQNVGAGAVCEWHDGQTICHDN